MSEEYASKRLELRRPPKPFSFVQMAGGILTLGLIFIGLIYNFDTLKDLNIIGSDLLELTEAVFGGETAISSAVFLLTLALFAVIVIPNIVRYLVIGLQFIIRAINEIVTPWRPANVPENFRSHGEVDKAFMERSITIYKPFDSFISGIFSGNSMFTTPARRKIVEENSKFLNNRLIKLFIVIGMLGGIILIINWIKTQAAFQILSDMDFDFIIEGIDDSATKELRTPFILLLILQVILTLIEYATTLYMIPRRQPSTVAHKGVQHYRGFGHPDQLFSRLPEITQSLQWEGFLNRVDSSWGERASAAVGDVGEFTGRIFIEQQPRPVRGDVDRPAYVMLAIGWALSFFGLYLFLFQLIPMTFRQGETNLIHAPIFTVMVGLAASISASSGRRFLGYSRNLFESALFKSIGLLIRIRGTLSRADIKVGKSIADSIESSNVVVRSDFSAELWTAELTSEATRLDSLRDLLALDQTNESQSWLDFFRNEIEALRVEGVKPIGIDLEGEEVDSILKANIGVSTLRSSAIEMAQLQAATEGEEDLLLLDAVESADAMEGEYIIESRTQNTGEYKECPDCAEMIKIRARKCRFCDYRFDED